ncbi:MAG TPA: PHP domain-containing protein [Bacilli bacterium]|nr:PHP domain-containing protein [Bacilli bacterium]
MNNYEFWEQYLDKVKSEILKLCRKKNELHIDLHIHSDHSSDGKQNIKQIIESTREKGFDIIAITDHDSLEAYEELYDYVKNGITTPIIIPGIEFTLDNMEYGNQCHLLQLFVNPKDKIIKKDVLVNYHAMFNRSKIQFDRLNDNKAVNEILKNYKISISLSEYNNYLISNQLAPEYDTLCFYLIDKFKSKNVTTFKVLELLEKYNEEDCYADRKEFKRKRYNQLREKYEITTINEYNSRFLLSMLAVREVDDDWWEKPSCGSLSVNSYGQLKIDELNEKYNIYFAHPTEKSLKVVDKIIKSKKNIVGLELNIRNKYENIDNFYEILNANKLLKIIGSDSHDNSLQFYEDMDFYKIKSSDFKKIVNIK